MNGRMSGGTETMTLGDGMGFPFDLTTATHARGAQTAGNLDQEGMIVRVGNRKLMPRTRDIILVHLIGDHIVPRRLLATTSEDHSPARIPLVPRLHHARR